MYRFVLEIDIVDMFFFLGFLHNVIFQIQANSVGFLGTYLSRMFCTLIYLTNIQLLGICHLVFIVGIVISFGELFSCLYVGV